MKSLIYLWKCFEHIYLTIMANKTVTRMCLKKTKWTKFELNVHRMTTDFPEKHSMFCFSSWEKEMNPHLNENIYTSRIDFWLNSLEFFDLLPFLETKTPCSLEFWGLTLQAIELPVIGCIWKITKGMNQIYFTDESLDRLILLKSIIYECVTY